MARRLCLRGRRGFAPNIISDYRTLQQENNSSLGNLMNQSIAQQLEALDYIYTQYGLNTVFATQEDIVTQSQILQARAAFAAGGLHSQQPQNQRIQHDAGAQTSATAARGYWRGK